MQISVPYGKTQLTATLPAGIHADIIKPQEIAPASDPDLVVRSALSAPVGDVSFDTLDGINTVAIAINDKTRPVPHQHLLPPLLEQLESKGISPENITLLIATGTHPVMPPEEYTWILPQSIIDRYHIICHDAYDKSTHSYLGETSRKTPVYLNTVYMTADLRIVVGNIEPHQFMGFSGGVKSAAIGVAGKETINANHAMMMDDNARLGAYDNNPARQDVEEIGQMIKIDLALNALLDAKKQIVDVLFGDPVAVMRRAIPRVREIYQVPLTTRYDLLIASPGGNPKDINVYQAQKGLAHATLAMNDGGTIILCAACPEGTGSNAYESWIMDGKKHNHEDVFKHFQHGGFQVGPHKAFQISRDATRVQVMLISEMSPEFVRQLLLHPLPDLQTALEKACESLSANDRVGIMPSANNTIPLLVS